MQISVCPNKQCFRPENVLGQAVILHPARLLDQAHNNFVPLLKSLIANVLKCKARLKTNFKCIYITMCSLVISLFSHDYIKTEID